MTKYTGVVLARMARNGERRYIRTSAGRSLLKLMGEHLKKGGFVNFETYYLGNDELCNMELLDEPPKEAV